MAEIITTDIRGQLLKKGDLVATSTAALGGRSNLRLGRVVRINTSRGFHVVHIQIKVNPKNAPDTIRNQTVRKPNTQVVKLEDIEGEEEGSWLMSMGLRLL